MAVNTISSDPGQWSLQDASQRVRESVQAGPTEEVLKSGLLYLAGDNWNAKPFKGPGRDANGMLSTAVSALIQTVYTPLPEAAVCVQRRVNGVCKTEADFSLEVLGKPDEYTPTTAEEREMQDWDAAMRDVWQRTAFWQAIKEAVANASAAGWATLRWFINPQQVRPDEKAEGGSSVQRGGTFEERAAHLELVAPAPNSCCIYVDPDTRDRTAVFLFTDRNEKSAAEIWYVRDGITYLRIVSDGESQGPFSYRWSGLLPIVQFNIRPLLTRPVLEMQATLDAMVTGLVRNQQLHAYSSVSILDAIPPGTWSETPPVGGVGFSRLRGDGVLEYLDPIPPEFGPAVINYIQGREVISEEVEADGKRKTIITKPEIVEHKPSSPQAIIEGIDFIRDAIRETCSQGHVTRKSTAEASGDAYEQARAEYTDDIEIVSQALAEAVAKTLTVGTVIILYLTEVDDPDWPKRYSVSVTMHPNSGHVSSGRRAELRADFQAGIKSRRSAIAESGVQDVSAEAAEIDNERSLTRIKEMLEIAGDAIDKGADPRAAYIQVRFNDEEADALIASDVNRPTEQ